MFAEALKAVRSEVSGERALEAVRAIARHHRIQSTPGYDEAAEWLALTLKEAGLTPRVERVQADGLTRHRGALLQRGWHCERASAVLHGRSGREPLADFAAEPLSIVQRSVAMSGRFPLVVVGEGTEPAHYEGVSVTGKVVLSSGPVHRVLALALQRGAAGLLTDFRRELPPVRTRAVDQDAIAYTSFWWNEGGPRGWGFVVSPRVGARLRERLAAGEALEIEGEIAARFFDTRTPLVTAAIEAPGPDAREVLVMGHLCHPRPGANDNASGAAAVLECARTLAALERRGAWRPLVRTVRFLWMPEWNGTLAWLAADPGRAARLDAAINLDMVGEDQAQCGSTLLLEHPPHWCGSFAEPLVAAIRREWIAASSNGASPRVAEVPYSGGSDHAILLDPSLGVPCPVLIQWPDRYYHSSFDTPDRCDPRSLALASGVAATYAAALASAGESEITALGALIERDGERRRQGTDTPSDLMRKPEYEGARIARARASLARLAGGGRADGNQEPRRAAVGSERVPVRRMDSPLDLLFHLLPGWDVAPATEHERWRALELELPGGRLTLELAWYACDGERSLEEIASMIEAETGNRPPVRGEAGPSLEAFFEAAARLGIAAWKEAGGR